MIAETTEAPPDSVPFVEIAYTWSLAYDLVTIIKRNKTHNIKKLFRISGVFMTSFAVATALYCNFQGYSTGMFED